MISSGQIEEGATYFLYGIMALVALVLAVVALIFFAPFILPIFVLILPVAIVAYAVYIAVMALWALFYGIMLLGTAMYYFFNRVMKVSNEDKDYSISGTNEAGTREKGESLSIRKPKKKEKK